MSFQKLSNPLVQTAAVQTERRLEYVKEASAGRTRRLKLVPLELGEHRDRPSRAERAARVHLLVWLGPTGFNALRSTDGFPLPKASEEVQGCLQRDQLKLS